MKKKNNITLVIFLVLSYCKEIQATPLSSKFPFGLLTEDYGVLSETDLLIDTWRAKAKPFNPNEQLNGYNYWQCFPTKNIKPKTRSWKDSDGTGSSNRQTTYCELDIEVSSPARTDLYSGRRAQKLEFCIEFTKDWKKLTSNEPYVCLNGEYVETEITQTGRGKNSVQIWIFDKFKTPKGCWSYFEDYCDIETWKKIGYPKKTAKK